MYLSFRAKLLGAFAANLLLLVALGIFVIHQMGTMEGRAAFIGGQAIPALEYAGQIDVDVHRYRTLQQEYLINVSAADRQRVGDELAVLEQQMDENFDAFGRLTLADEQRSVLGRLRATWAIYTHLTHDEFMPDSEQQNTGTVQPSFNRMNPYYTDLLGASRRLSELSRTQSADAVAVVNGAYETSRYVILAVAGGAVIISAVIGLVLGGTIVRRVGRLTETALAVADGDLERSVPAVGNDELGRLARNFNQMILSLRHQRLLLEERNRELLASLANERALREDLVLRRAAEAAALQAEAAATAANQAKSMFLATMSHELRTPLQAILGYAQIIQFEVQADGQNNVLPQLDRIISAGRHLQTIINNVLDFSKIEQGKMDLDRSIVNVGALARDVISIVQPLAAQRKNTLKLDCPVYVSPIETDSGKLRQVLYNLLANACKFTEHGAIVLSVQLDDAADQICFAISDTGIGISPEQMDRLFQPFVQADTSTTRRYGGTGLGLALSLQLCALLGGALSVSSELGVGSIFTVRIPTDSQPHDDLALAEYTHAIDPSRR